MPKPKADEMEKLKAVMKDIMKEKVEDFATECVGDLH